MDPPATTTTSSSDSLHELLIVMCGPPESGKSCSLETIFERIPIRRGKSQLHQIFPIEYHKKVPLVKSEAIVRIIDFRGFSNVLEEDPNKVITHSSLRPILHNRQYPDIILFTVSAGITSESQLRNALAVLNGLRLINGQCNNLIVIVTHALNIPKSTFDEDCARIEQKIKTAVKQVTNVENVAVHFVENDYKVYQKQRLFLNDLLFLQEKMKVVCCSAEGEDNNEEVNRLKGEIVDTLFALPISYDVIPWQLKREEEEETKEERLYQFEMMAHGYWKKTNHRKSNA